jgi:hypothetical protein
MTEFTPRSTLRRRFGVYVAEVFLISTRRALLLTAVALLAVLYYGPFFVWLPVTPGFVKERHDPVVVLRRPGSARNPAEERFAAAARAAERDVGLTFTGAVPLVLCDSWSDLRRFMPWLPVNRGLGARTLPLGHVVYVTPLVRDRPDADVFVHHELIHVLLHQHMPVLQRLDGGRPAWLIEGVATLYGNPRSYPSGAALSERMRGVDAGRLIREGPGVADGAALFYPVSRDFVARLVERHGAATLRGFLRDYVSDPAAWPIAFARRFGRSFDAAVAEFSYADAG